MSDPKRATLITVGAPNSAKNNVTKTVRLTINLDESNESKYPELNYKELVIAEERKKRLENGKTSGLDPFSDNDDDVERVARKFEQKYGGKSTYGRKGRSKHDDFADIGAGYDENDPFIDNTDGYDEMIPPECDTFYGGFYINSGSLEFKNVPENQTDMSDGEPAGNRRNKRRLSSSSSDEESSESSSESESQEEKDSKVIANGAVDSHKTEHRKKKNKKIDKKKAKKVRRTDSSAATSGKQTSDDNGHHGDGESADSRTSQSDSLTSKPAPSSEKSITSDSSREAESKVEVQLPPAVIQVLEELEVVSRQLDNLAANEVEAKTDPYLNRLEQTLSKCFAPGRVCRTAWNKAAKTLNTTRVKLVQRVKPQPSNQIQVPPTSTVAQPTATTITTTMTQPTKRKMNDVIEEDFSRLTDQEREVKITETLKKLKSLIEDRKPGMISNYNAECERVQEERKKIQIASDGAPHIEKRLPKRRFPWCPRSRSLLARLKLLAGKQEAAAVLLADRALPLFPKGFVRMPTLLRQADLSKEVKASEIKRHRHGSITQQPLQAIQSQFVEPIQFPSSLTVTTMKTSDTNDIAVVIDDKEPKQTNSVFNSIFNSLTLNKDLLVDKSDDRKDDKKEELYIPPNNIGSITITPVPQDKVEKSKKEQPLIRVKSPSSLNEMVKKDKKKEKVREKRVDSPLHIETNFQNNKKERNKDSPKTKDEVSQKQIETMRVNENNIPRPALVPVHHSPTFAKPDKRPPEVKKKKEVLIVSDVDPLGDIQQEPVAVDDSSSDVEVVEDKTDKSDNSAVPSKDNSDKNNVKHSSNRVNKDKDVKDQNHDTIFDSVMKNLREMEHSQESARVNAYGEVISNAKHEKSSKQAFNNQGAIFGESRSDKDKFAERTSLNKMDGSSAVTVGISRAIKEAI